MDATTADVLKNQLIEDGYCHVPDVAPLDLIEKIRGSADALADAVPEEEKQLRRHQGSIISVYEHEEMLPIIMLPAAIDVLRNLGYPNPRFYSGYIISKPPEMAPPLYWHQDGILWNQPVSYTDTPHQFFLMYYLIDTNRENGCLRVIPGSHLRRHRLHRFPHKTQYEDDHHPALQEDTDELDVPVKVGDLVIGDARLLHSAHPNHSNQRRTVITLWFCPTFEEMPENIQAFYGCKYHERPAGWSDQGWKELSTLRTSYTGSVVAPETDRVPDERLA